QAKTDEVKKAIQKKNDLLIKNGGQPKESTAQAWARIDGNASASAAGLNPAPPPMPKAPGVPTAAQLKAPPATAATPPPAAQAGATAPAKAPKIAKTT